MITASVTTLVAMVVCAGVYAAVDWWAWLDTADTAPTGPAGDAAESPFASPGADGTEAAPLAPFAEDLSVALDLSGALEVAQRAVRSSMGPMLVGGWIMTLLDSNGNGGGGGDGGSGGGGSSGQYGALQGTDGSGFDDPLFLGVMAGVLLGVAFCLVVLVLVRAWIAPGWMRMHREALVEGRGTFRTLFGSTDRLVPMLLWRILRQILLWPIALLAFGPFVALLVPTLLESPDAAPESMWFAGVGFALAIPLWLWVGPALMLGGLFVSLDNDGPVTGLRRSWQAAAGNRVRLLLFWFLLAVLQALAVVFGLLLFCVGALFTIPWGRALVDVCWARAWLIGRHGPEAMMEWGAPAEDPAH